MRTLLVSLCLLVTTPALAGYDSAYTKYDLEKCKQISPGSEEGEASPTYECEGYKDKKIYFAEGDLRGVVAFGKNGPNHCAFGQTFPQFNTVNETVEWRLKDGVPIATIQRWTSDYGVDDEGRALQKIQWLVVTKLEPAQSCRLAIIQASLPNANEKARQAADTLAENFKCETGIVTVQTKPAIKADDVISDNQCRIGD
jgi:hypothetical protein